MNFSPYQIPLLAFYSRKLYGSVARRRKGTGLLYLFLLLLICYPLSLAAGYLHAVSGLDSPQINEIVGKLPDLTLKNGILQINKASPYRMTFKDASTGEEKLIIFDTSGKTTGAGEARALITERGIFFAGQSEIMPFPLSNEDFHLSAAGFKETVRGILFGIACASLLLFPLVYCGHLLLAVIYGIVGMVMDRHNLGFSSSLRMASTAMTPAIVLTTLFYVIWGRPEMFFYLLVWEVLTVPVTVVYLYFAYSSVEPPANN